MVRGLALLVALVVVSTGTGAQRGKSQRQAPPGITRGIAQTSSAAPLTITAEPNAIIWIDEIRRGVTDASGKLVLARISSGRHTLRVRATGFKEVTTALLPGRRSIAVKLVQTTDQAELLFQQAETASEKAKDEAAKQRAVELYREALKLRPAFPAAHVG